MTYLEFSERVLETFEDFTNYFFNVYHAKAYELLPSVISSMLIEYHDNAEINDTNKLTRLLNFLVEMSKSNDEDLVMLYNETLINIQNTNYLKNTKIVELQTVDPLPGLSTEQIKQHTIRKLQTTNETGKSVLQKNKELFEKYLNKSQNEKNVLKKKP